MKQNIDRDYQKGAVLKKIFSTFHRFPISCNSPFSNAEPPTPYQSLKGINPQWKAKRSIGPKIIMLDLKCCSRPVKSANGSDS